MLGLRHKLVKFGVQAKALAATNVVSEMTQEHSRRELEALAEYLTGNRGDNKCQKEKEQMPKKTRYQMPRRGPALTTIHSGKADVTTCNPQWFAFTLRILGDI